MRYRYVMGSSKGWSTVSVREDLMARVDRFVETNQEGFHSRGEVVATALREFFAKHERRPPM